MLTAERSSTIHGLNSTASLVGTINFGKERNLCDLLRKHRVMNLEKVGRFRVTVEIKEGEDGRGGGNRGGGGERMLIDRSENGR